MRALQRVSVVIPCHNEEAVLPLLFDRLQRAAAQWGIDTEVILVDDGSTDTTWSLACQLAHRDPSWKALRFSRNFGHQSAVSAGLHYAEGDVVVVMDADLQDPPEVLARFLEAWRDGADVVYAIRRQRKEGLLKRAGYAAFYRIWSMFTGIEVPLDAGDFCLMDRQVVDLINAMPEQNRFIRGLRAWSGFQQVGVTYDRPGRAAGRTQYTLSKLVKLAVDGIVSFSTTPLRMATYLGLLVSSLSFAGAVFTLLQRLFARRFEAIGLGPVPGFATIVISILFLGGVQLICLGIIGEYIGRIYDEVKRRPLWVVADAVGLDP